jgi:hypothetical protein
MQWYYWVLIGAVVVAAGILKVVIFQRIQKKRRSNQAPKEEPHDED